MFALTIAALVVIAMLLAWPSEAVNRLHRLRLKSDATSTGSLVAAMRSRSARGKQQSAQSIDALSSLEAELQSGQAPGVALLRAAGLPPVWPSAIAALRIGGDVAQGLRMDGRQVPVLLHLAACWEVASHTGSGLGQSVAMLAESARTREELAATLNAELAGPRATTRVLMLLPAIGILLGFSLGADPLGWLLGTAFGLVCATGGLLLTAAGWLWSRQLVGKVESQL
ncbi:MAG: hypothetical protein Q8M73_03295 [Actinomycetota bacterium]|nr:hypothetical protein [Actinomycetota bacterium]